MTLEEIEVGRKVKVQQILGEGALRRHIMDMGVTKGTLLEIVRVAPLGDPLQIKVRGYQLSIRKSEANSIVVA